MRPLARRRLARALVPCYLLLVGGMPMALTSVLVARPRALAGRIAALLLAPPLFVLAYVVIAGGLARRTRRAIVAGRFPRDLGDPVYGPRRLYARCWTAVCYFTPIYHAVLAVPLLKRIILRLFGYRGALDVTSYPDTWIRDLPLLDIATGACIANRATLGTNMRMQDGTVVGDAAEIGVGCGIGIGVSIGRGAKIGPTTSVSHRAIIGEHADIGVMCLIGAKAVIHPRVRIPAGRIIPPRAVIRNDADVETLRRATPVAAMAMHGE